MTAARHPLGIVTAPPYGGLAIGRTASASHTLSLSWLANEVAMAPALLFYLDRPGDADSTPVDIRVKCPLRRNADRRVWIVTYETPQIAGRLELAPGVAPLNATDDEWASGQYVEVYTSERRAPRPLYFFEDVDTTGYTYPDTDAEITFQLTWPGTGSTALTITSVACWELPLNSATQHQYGMDPEPVAARRAIMSSGTAIDADGGARQFMALAEYAAYERNRRVLFDTWAPSGLGTFNSEVWSEIFDYNPRVHPRRMYRNNPGWSYTPATSHGSVEVWFYGQNSATNQGHARVKSAYNTTGVSTADEGLTFPISPTAAAWRGPVRIQCYCESCFSTAPQFVSGTPLGSAVASVRGMLTNASATDDCDAEGADRATSAWEETLSFQARGKSSGEAAANTLSLYGICVIQI